MNFLLVKFQFSNCQRQRQSSGMTIKMLVANILPLASDYVYTTDLGNLPVNRISVVIVHQMNPFYN